MDGCQALSVRRLTHAACEWIILKRIGDTGFRWNHLRISCGSNALPLNYSWSLVTPIDVGVESWECAECAWASIDSTDNIEAGIIGMDNAKVAQYDFHGLRLKGAQRALLFYKPWGHCSFLYLASSAHVFWACARARDPTYFIMWWHTWCYLSNAGCSCHFFPRVLPRDVDMEGSALKKLCVKDLSKFLCEKGIPVDFCNAFEGTL